MASKKNYYEILGVGRLATHQEIRRRYRELVRTYHPDIHPDKELSHQMMIQILEAYKVLGDPQTRTDYDSRLAREAEAVRRPVSPPPSRPRQAPAPQQPSSRRRTHLSEADRFISNARLDFLVGNMHNALVNCKRAIQMDPRNAEAHMILGDVYRALKKNDEAMTMYTLAAQFDPRSAEIRQRVNRMAKQESQINAEPEIAPKRDQRQELLRVAIWSFGAAVILVFLFLLNAYPGVPAWPYLHPISLLSQNMVMVLGAISFLLGGLLTVTRAIERADDELFFSTIHIVGGRHQSFGVIMIALTIVWYYLGFITYFILGIQNNNISSSVLKAYIAALAAVALVAIAAPAAATQLFLLGANFSFGLVLLGWVIGDIFRPLV